jgi:hypothetical protein
VDGAPTLGGGGAVPVVWTSLTGTASATGNDLSGGSSSGAISTVSVTGDADVEWVMNDGSVEMYVGLGTDTTANLGATMSHAFHFGTGVYEIREAEGGVSVYKTEFGWSAGDVFRFNIVGTTVKYYQDDVLKYTSLNAVSLPKKLDVGFYGGGGSLDDATIEQAGADNVMPTVNAGPNVTITPGGTADLDGLVVDDGQPSGTVTATWSKALGPGTVNFADANAAVTTATVSSVGTYILRLTGSDGALSSYDDVLLMATAPELPPGGRPYPRVFIGNIERTDMVRA